MLTLELTRRREFNQASPDQLSYQTRSRRSRPTICYVAFFHRIGWYRTPCFSSGVPAIEIRKRSYAVNAFRDEFTVICPLLGDDASSDELEFRDLDRPR